MDQAVPVRVRQALCESGQDFNGAAWLQWRLSVH
jgi:hypothetical protein